MSDLSYLIQTQNQVLIDNSYLKHCQQQNQITQRKKSASGLTKLLSSKQIHLNKIKARNGTKGNSSLQKSIQNLFTSSNNSGPSVNQSTASIGSDKTEWEQLSKISMRIQALEENRKRLEQKVGVQLFQMKSDIQKKNYQQNDQIEEVKRIKNNLSQSKKKIGDLLNFLSMQVK